MDKKYRLLSYMKRHKWKYILGFIVLWIVDVFNLYIPQYTGEITDGLQTHTMNMQGVIQMIVKILFVGLILAIGRFLWRICIFGAARKIEFELRNDMYKHLETLSMRYYNENKTGELMSYFTNDLAAIRMAVGPAIIATFDAIVMTFLVLTKMIMHVNLQLTLLAVIPMVFILFGSVWYGKLAERLFGAKQQAFSELTDQVQESISGVRVIKAFVQEKNEIKAFAKANKNNKDKNMKVVKLQATFMPLLDVVIGFSGLITLFYGGYLTMIGQISLGRFIAFNQYIFMLVWPMIAVGDSITFISQGRASLKRIYKVFEEKPDIMDESIGSQKNLTEDGANSNVVNGEIGFNHLTFCYPNQERVVLKDITLRIKPGETLAILGRTGSGKTTIANLLLRMYNVEYDMITIDGKDLRKLPLHVLRKNIAYVPQDNFLFSDTLENNIAFGCQIVDHELVVEAAKQACVHDNIIEFPMQYETIVGERGVTLSGGQKQRSSIARALIMDAPILILDDALSAVDTDTEERILHNLASLRKGKTTIIIAHRISTIQNADNILVLDEGCMVEYGTHASLLEKNGIYADLYHKQQLERELVAEE